MQTLAARGLLIGAARPTPTLTGRELLRTRSNVVCTLAAGADSEWLDNVAS
jgi:hypothetical protein